MDEGWHKGLTLNLLARKLAVEHLQSHPDLEEVHCAISCHIGSPEILVVYFDKQMNELGARRKNIYPTQLIDKLKLNTPRFADMCRNGLFA